jgi:hypothetical protein
MALLLGCAHGNDAPGRSRTEVKGAERISFITSLQGRRPPVPIIEVKVAGRSTLLIVDTGASYHYLGQWLVNDLELAVDETTELTRDHAGRHVPTLATEPISITAGGWLLVDHARLPVVELPQALKELGIGGLISPQFLARGETVVVDGVSGQLMRSPAVQVPTSAQELSMCQHDGPEFPFWKVVVPARVEGSPLLLEIDSGGSSSGVQLDSATGALLQKRVPVKEAGGKSLGIAGEFTTTSLDNAEIEVGALKFVRDIDLLPGTSSDGCFYDGVLGMDVLATCQIYLTDSRATLSCGSDT